MLKFIKRLFLLCFILAIGAGVWGYQNGLRPDNYKVFISDLFSTNQEVETVPQVETKPKATKKTASKKTTSNDLQPLPANPFSSIDRHSRNCPSSVATDIEGLAAYLQQKASTDLEKARAIYIWITDNIGYDDDAYNTGVYPNYTPDYVLQKRKAVCDGYSNLYKALGEEMGLNVEKVSGYAKGYGYSPGRKFGNPDHAWNAMKINGKWRIFDSTWGSGNGSNVNGKLVSKKEFDDYWFDVDPYQSIFNHFPTESNFTFVQPPISLSQYEQFPKIENGYFKLGFDGRETYSMAISNPNLEFPEYYKINTNIEVISAPKFKTLEANQSYSFEFYVPRGLTLAIIDPNNNWTNFERDKGKFSLTFKPEHTGELKISVQHEKSGNSFETILMYEVKRGSEPI